MYEEMSTLGRGGGGGGRVVVLSCDVVCVFPVFLVSVSTVVLLLHFLCWSLFIKKNVLILSYAICFL